MHQLIDIVDSIQHGTGIGVSDGSVRTTIGKATHALIFQANNGSAICGSGPVDGTTEARTSHRAEIQGSAALLVTLSLIVNFFNITGGKIVTYCDNQAVVKKTTERVANLEISTYQGTRRRPASTIMSSHRRNSSKYRHQTADRLGARISGQQK